MAARCQDGAVTGRRVRLLIAVGAAVLVAGVAFAAPHAGRQGSKHQALPAGKLLGAEGVSAEAPVSGKASSSRVAGFARPYLSRPLRDIKPAPPAPHGNKSLNETEHGYPLRFPHGTSRPGDGALQTSPGSGQMPAPLQNFDGVSNVDGLMPPDTEGEVGPNHYVQWINLSFAVYNKTGGLVYGPAHGNTLFTGLPHCGGSNDGDPIMMYDQLAGRWFASQFHYQTPYYQCIAVSSTDDPTGTWCRYEFQVQTNKFDDYPKFGVWPSQNAYMMTGTQFLNFGSFAGFGVWGFERDKMLACQTAHMVYQDMENVDPSLPYILPADVDGPTPPPDGAPAPIVAMNLDLAGLPEDKLQVWHATIDWTTPSISVAHESDLQAAAYDSTLCDYFTLCIPQPGTTHLLAPMSDRLMFRLAYRNFGTWEAMAVSHSVDTDGSNHAGVRWYELQRTTGDWGIQQQGTYAPADGVNRWMPSVAMDKSGDLAVGYSVSNGTDTYPGVRYAGRLVSDPPNELTQGEATLIDGSGSQLGALGRWGDYSDMTVDPADDCTFWYTQEYVQTTGGQTWKTRIGSLQVPVVRAGSAAAPAAPAPAAAPAPTPAWDRRLHDLDPDRSDDRPGHGGCGDPLRRLLTRGRISVPGHVLRPDVQLRERAVERRSELRQRQHVGRERMPAVVAAGEGDLRSLGRRAPDQLGSRRLHGAPRQSAEPPVRDRVERPLRDRRRLRRRGHLRRSGRRHSDRVRIGRQRGRPLIDRGASGLRIGAGRPVPL